MQSLHINSELCFLHTNPVKSAGNLSRRSSFVDFNKAPQHSELLRLDPVSPHQQGVDTSERWLSSVARPVSQAGCNLLSHHSGHHVGLPRGDPAAAPVSQVSLTLSSPVLPW